MTISHVIYLEFARLIVSWQWVTEVNIQHLKKYETDMTYQDWASLPDSFVHKPESEEFEVKKIVGHRRVGKRAVL